MMNLKSKKLFNFWLVGLILLNAILVFHVLNRPLTATIYGNGGGTFYTPRPFPPGVIEDYIIDGAGYYLESYSNFLLILKQPQLNEGNVDNRREFLSKAISNLQGARLIYRLLNEELEQRKSEGDKNLIKKLKNFDYHGFRKKNRLVEPIFDDVRRFLVSSRSWEVYKEILKHCDRITESLLSIRAKLRDRYEVKKTTLWELNQLYSRSLLFGEYVARVFITIIKEHNSEKEGKK